MRRRVGAYQSVTYFPCSKIRSRKVERQPAQVQSLPITYQRTLQGRRVLRVPEKKATTGIGLRRLDLCFSSRRVPTQGGFCRRSTSASNPKLVKIASSCFIEAARLILMRTARLPSFNGGRPGKVKPLKKFERDFGSQLRYLVSN